MTFSLIQYDSNTVRILIQHKFQVHLETTITLNHIEKPSHLLANRRTNFALSSFRINYRKCMEKIFIF